MYWRFSEWTNLEDWSTLGTYFDLLDLSRGGGCLDSRLCFGGGMFVAEKQFLVVSNDDGDENTENARFYAFCILCYCHRFLRHVDNEVKENGRNNALIILDAHPADNDAHRNDADKEIHSVPNVLVDEFILVRPLHKNQGEMPS